MNTRPTCIPLARFPYVRPSFLLIPDFLSQAEHFQPRRFGVLEGTRLLLSPSISIPIPILLPILLLPPMQLFQQLFKKFLLQSL